MLNNYPLDEVWAQVRRGEKPDHHLYGLDQLQARGHQVTVVGDGGSSIARWLAWVTRGGRLPIPLGHIERQWSAWRRLREADVVYAPCGGELTALAYLRALGLLDTPLVAIEHHALNPGRLAAWRAPWLRLQARGTDRWLALSRQVAGQIDRHLPTSRPRATALAWGPDRRFYPRAGGPGAGVLAAGRTGRDFLTFGRAASRAGYPARIVCLGQDLHPDFARFGAHVRIDTPGRGAVFTYPEMMGLHQEARVLAIPLHASPASLAGLTSLVDALALGKPVIMTRNPYIDLDIEALGIGRWVDAGDEEGWVAAIAWFRDHPDEAERMGRRARSLVDEGRLHSDAFADAVEAELTLACSPATVPALTGG